MYKFPHYCIQRNINPAQANFKIGIEYLIQYFYTGVSYSSVNTARSVLFSILKLENGTLFGEDPLVCRLLKRVFNLRPSLPRYTTTWDVSVCFRYIKSLSSLNECDLIIQVSSSVMPDNRLERSDNFLYELRSDEV